MDFEANRVKVWKIGINVSAIFQLGQTSISLLELARIFIYAAATWGGQNVSALFSEGYFSMKKGV